MAWFDFMPGAKPGTIFDPFFDPIADSKRLQKESEKKEISHRLERARHILKTCHESIARGRHVPQAIIDESTKEIATLESELLAFV